MYSRRGRVISTDSELDATKHIPFLRYGIFN